MAATPGIATRGLRAVCVLLIVVGLLAAGYAVLMRMRVERAAPSRAVELVIDYPEVAALAGKRGLPLAEALQRLQHDGATAVALSEETVGGLESQGDLTIGVAPGGENAPAVWTPGSHVVDLHLPDPATYQFVLAGLQRAYPADSLKEGGAGHLLVLGEVTQIRDLGLGLRPEKVAAITEAGLRTVPRLHGSAWMSAAYLNASLDEVARLLPTRGGAHPLVIFDGKALPGYRQLIPNLAEALQARGLTYGSVEFGKQRGDTELGTALDGQLIRVHSIAIEELATLSPQQAVGRFALAAKDRNIRALYVHLSPDLADAEAVTAGNPVGDAGAYLAKIKRAVQADGAQVGAEWPAQPLSPLHQPWPLLAIVYVGASAGLLLWVLNVLPERLPARGVALCAILLGLAALVAVGVTFPATARPGLGRALFGLAAATAFPLIGLTAAYRATGRIAVARPARVVFPALFALLAATLSTLIGGLYVAASLADSLYLAKVEQYSGVKVAMALPLLLFAVLLVTDGAARSGETLTDYVARCKARLQDFLAQPLFLWTVGLTLVLLVVFVLVMVRSGNDAGATVSGTELQFRALLERFLVARPRTKEFLFGHPLFILGFLAAARGYRPAAGLLLLAGAIGQVDVLNTYCHAHTPVALSLLRTMNGLWLGAIIGIVAMLLLSRTVKNAPEPEPIVV